MRMAYGLGTFGMMDLDPSQELEEWQSDRGASEPLKQDAEVERKIPDRRPKVVKRKFLDVLDRNKQVSFASKTIAKSDRAAKAIKGLGTDVAASAGEVMTFKEALRRDGTLDLGGLGLGECEAVALANALPHMKVYRLVLRGNKLADAGTRALSFVLPQMSALRKLDLRGNHIKDDGAAALASVLPTLLRRKVAVDLGGNEWGEEGLAALTHAISLGPAHAQAVQLWLHRV